MRAAARSVVFFVASSSQWLMACVGAGDDAPGLMAVDAGKDTSGGDGASGDASRVDRTTGDASPVDGAGGEAAMAGDGSDAAKPVTTTSTVGRLRVANWSPDAPAVDFCIAPHGGAYQGPVVAAALGDAGSGALGFPKVSAYSFVMPGAYDVRIVVAASGVDCSLSGLLVPDATNVMLAAGGAATLALIGDAQAGSDSGVGLKLLALPDDVVGPGPKTQPDGATSDQFAMRFVHAAPALYGDGGLALADSLCQDPMFSSVKWSFKGVPFGHSNPWKDGGTDPNSYQLEPAVTSAAMDVFPSGQDAGADLFPTATLTAAGGSVLTIVLAGSASLGAAIQLLECVDNAAATTEYSTCRMMSISTCGNGKVDPFEECDCGSGGAVSTDPQCASSVVPANGPLPSHICSTTCHLN